MKHSREPFKAVFKEGVGGGIAQADIYSGSVRIGAATIRDEIPWRANADLFARSASMHTALRVIRTWASVPGALDVKNVLELIDRTLDEGGEMEP